MARSVALVSGSCCAAAGAWVVYDRQTMHGMRTYSPWSAADSLVRLQNAALPDARVFSRAELRRHDGGAATRPVLFAARGGVYDVSGNASFAAGGCYATLAGRDATYALATMSLDPADLDRRDALDAASRAALENWVAYLDQKYRRVGRLADSDAGALGGAPKPARARGDPSG